MSGEVLTRLPTSAQDPFETVDDDDQLTHAARVTVECGTGAELIEAPLSARPPVPRPATRAEATRDTRASRPRAPTPQTPRYSVDNRGIPAARVLVTTAAAKSERRQRKDAEKKCLSYVKIALAAFVALPGSFTLYHMGRRAVTRSKTIAVLEDFYARAQPDKVAKAGGIADKYEGFEELLFKRLEKQYPEHKVCRRPPCEAEEAPAEKGEEEDEDHIEL